MALKKITRETFGYQGGLSGFKMIIGATLIVFAGQLETLNEVLKQYPSLGDFSFVQSLKDFFEAVIYYLQYISKYLGEGFFTVGFLHKVKKFFRALFK